jgi:hypothetical protein
MSHKGKTGGVVSSPKIIPAKTDVGDNYSAGQQAHHPASFRGLGNPAEGGPMKSINTAVNAREHGAHKNIEATLGPKGVHGK